VGRGKKPRPAEPAGVTAEDERLIDAWLAYAATDDRQHSDAWDEITRRVYDRPDEAWALLLRLVERVPDELLSWVGAGPLETLLARHGAEFGARAVAKAWQDQRFRDCLSAVWLQRSAVPPKVARNLAQVTEGSVLFFPR
jgi:hypothetical protein